MNNRIKLLEPQCWEHNEFGLNFNYQKFAELIVRECVRIISKRKNQAIDDELNVDEAMSMAEIDLEEHFGVEHPV